MPLPYNLRGALTAWAIAHGVTADITGAPLTGSPRSIRPTPLRPGPITSDEGVESTMLEATIAAAIVVIEEPHAPAPDPILATPVRRASVTSTPAAAPRSRVLVAIAVLAIALLIATVARRALRPTPAGERAIPAGAVAP